MKSGTTLTPPAVRAPAIGPTRNDMLSRLACVGYAILVLCKVLTKGLRVFQSSPGIQKTNCREYYDRGGGWEAELESKLRDQLLSYSSNKQASMLYTEVSKCSVTCPNRQRT